MNELQCEALQVDNLISTTYKMPFYKSALSYYQIVDYEEGRRISYSPTKGHPLKGTATVEVNPTEDGSVLTWRAAFKSNGIFLRMFFKLYYEKKFFGRMEKKIRKLESRS